MRADILKRASDSMGRAGLSEEEAAARVAELGSLLAYANFTDVALGTLDENIFARALAAVDKKFGDQLALKAGLLVTIASTMKGLGIFEKAEPPMQEGLAIRRRLLGDDHRQTIETMGEVGTLLAILGRLDEGERVLREGLERARTRLGSDDAETMNLLNRLGLSLHASSRYDESEQCLHTRGRQAEAEPYFRETFERFLRLRGDDHIDTLRAASNLGRLLDTKGEYAEAETILRNGLTKIRSLRGDDHEESLSAASNLAALLSHMGKREEAGRLLSRALEGRIKLLGRQHPMTLDAMDNLGVHLADGQRYEEALPLLQEAMSGMEKISGRNSLFATIARIRVGTTLAKLGKFAEGEAHLLEVQRTLGSAHGASGESQWLIHLAELYENWDKAEPGKGHEAQARSIRVKIEKAGKPVAPAMPQSASPKPVPAAESGGAGSP